LLELVETEFVQEEAEHHGGVALDDAVERGSVSRADTGC
jgi:hypothetical protein